MQAKFAATQAARAKQLRASNSVSEAEAEKMFVDAETTAAALSETTAAMLRSVRDRLALENERQTQIVRLERESVQILGDIDNELAAIRRLERDLTERQLRAPVAGRIGEVAEVRVGSVVQAAQKLCVAYNSDC